ncbi:MAG TPA: hypothetical protein VJK54_11275 [Chthoniobacterales bacterium]|nr:hypothetical protein [Chthoniobacterales bacterium]
MNNDSLFSLEGSDLSNLLTPSWVKESESKVSFQSTDENKSRFTPASHHRFDRGASQGRGDQGAPRREQRSVGGRDVRGKRSSERFSSQGRTSLPPREIAPVFHGWNIHILPEQRGMDEIAKQIKTEAKAYPLFNLTRLILEKPERYCLQFVKEASSEGSKTPTSKLFQCLLDQTLWLSEQEVIAHLLKQYSDRYYRSERTTVESPTGSYSSIGICGMSQTLLGPSNHHEYQSKIIRLHVERFSNIPFDLFKSRIQTTRDEALIEKWKEEQSVREEFYFLNAPEGTEPEKFKNIAEVEAHFKKHEAAALIAEVSSKVILPGASVLKFSSNAIQRLVRQSLDQLKRFPLPLSHLVGQELSSRGLQIFKAHENIVYASVVRPRYLDRQETPISAHLTTILDCLEAHRKSSRAEQWKALLETSSFSSETSEKEQEAVIAKDLTWLIREGYIINYALRGFEVVRKPKIKNDRPLLKIASADEVQGVDGAEKLSVQKLLDASSTGATKQFIAEVEVGKKSNKKVSIQSLPPAEVAPEENDQPIHEVGVQITSPSEEGSELKTKG